MGGSFAENKTSRIFVYWSSKIRVRKCTNGVNNFAAFLPFFIYLFWISLIYENNGTEYKSCFILLYNFCPEYFWLWISVDLRWRWTHIHTMAFVRDVRYVCKISTETEVCPPILTELQQVQFQDNPLTDSSLFHVYRQTDICAMVCS